MDQSTRACEGCGDKLTPMKRAGNPKRFCSERCRAKVYRENNPEVVARKNEAAKLKARSRSVERDATDPRPRCKSCGEEMPRRRDATYCNSRPCRTAKYYARQDALARCSVGTCQSPVIARGYCGGHYRSEYYNPKFGASVTRSAKPRQCVCGETFMVKTGRKKYCSEGCRIAWLGKAPAEGRALVRWKPPAPVPEHEIRSPRRWTAGDCARCGTLFVRAGTGAVYCSETCSKRSAWSRFYQRRGEFVVPPKVRLAIYERDGWVCQLCFEPTARTYASDEPTSPTLDHIVPRSLQLIPDDSPSNLRLACALCNSLRGNDVNWAPEAIAS